ncbi:Flp family type IVb pilin [Virgibacillus litoralis]|uniref:Pilus assembly protein Flp/PilA n=1 Tax=Virgibacillus litoralis TaxID=578221 RepID=A0ABS4HED9_9BACI|nr:Flp family type IVb pilin [Virgibacillus litoralis]MBP1949287.1 pilus assembly protein Flp/PilA [Virgibacillus litoralis]
MNHFIRLFKEEEGQALTEYGLLVGLIAVAVIAVLGTMGGQLQEVFTRITTKLSSIL